MNVKIRTAIVDMNGKHTHVWRNAIRPAGTRDIPPLVNYSMKDEAALHESLREHHDTIVVSGREFSIAPEGKSAAFCFDCKGFFENELVRDYSIQVFDCPNCGSATVRDLWGVGIAQSSLKFLDADTTLRSSWFHGTVKKDWHKEITGTEKRGDTPMVHLGTLEAAIDRARDLSSEHDIPISDFVVHEIKMKDSMQLSENVVFDEMDNAPALVKDWHTGEFDHYNLFGSTRYVNIYESIGSISLLSNPHHFDIVNTNSADSF